MKVQPELMRYASIQSTLNVYGQALPASKNIGQWAGRTEGAHPREDECLKADFSYLEFVRRAQSL